jgi:glycosyltransferase involved in cell wall biosynthesis
VDIIHSLGYVSPLRVACPAVVTIHDLNYRAFGKSMPTVRRVALDFFVRKSALRAKHVMTGSHFARQQIIDGLGLPPGKVSVAYNAVTVRKRGGGVAENNEVVRMKYNFARPYIIAFGSGSPHKNIPRLLEAFAYVRACYRLKYQMVIVGHAMRYAQEIPWAMRDAVRFVGYMSDADLACILRGAEMLVYPSLYEGFGLPVLEAMAAGVPVVCSNVAALPEVGGDAAVYFNPCSVQDMGEKMMRVAQDRSLRQEMRERGYENVKRFSWEATAKATMAVYEYLGRLRD